MAELMSSTMKRDKEKAQQIQVFVRLRPLSQLERESRSLSCIEVVNSRELHVKQHHGKKYCFDGVFSPAIKQLTIYETIVKPLISEIFAGYNCTVFAYGQTGTGKTYTMAGGSSCSNDISWQDDEQAGIIPRAMAHLFDELRLIEQEYTVRVSYLELYNEELYDLLADGSDTNRIRIFEDQRQKGSVIVQGIEEQTVHNRYEVYKILEKGETKRRTASTLLNDYSSRSHTVFCITLHTRETTVEGEELVKTGKLNLVDLAGSENISRSGAVDRHAREAGNINQSLLNLGRVIKALVEKSAHIPYRASKLTRLLQDSLGGRTKTSIIATISPAVVSLDETLSTLDYANRARYITNRPEVNQRMSQKVLMTQYIEEIERLRKDLSAARTGSGVYLANENYIRLVADQQMCSDELAEKIVTIRDLEQQLKTTQDTKKALEEQWKQLCSSFDETNNKLCYYHDMFKKTAVEKDEQKHLAGCYAKNAATLYDQAKVLLNVTESSSANEAILHEKIEKLYSSAISNNETVKKINTSVGETCCTIIEEVSEFKHNYCSTNYQLIDTVKSLENIQTKSYEIMTSCTSSAGEQIKHIIDEFKNSLENQQEDTATLIDKLVNYCKGYTETVNNVQNWSSTQVCQYIEQMLATEKQQHEQFCSGIEDKLKEMAIAVSVLSQSVETELDSVKEELVFELKKLMENLIQQSNCTNDTMMHLNNCRKEIHKAVDCGFKIVQDKLLFSKDAENDSLVQADIIKNNVKSIFSTINEKVERSVNGTINSVNDLETIIEKSKCERPILVLQSKIMNDFNTDKQAREQLTISQLQNLSKDIESCSRDFMHANFEVLNQLKYTLEIKLENLCLSMQQQTEVTTELLSQSNHKSTAVLKELKNCNRFVTDCEASVFTKISDCKENLTNFVDDIIEIKHNGDSPVHLQYNYPTILKQPNSEDCILTNYRQQATQKRESLNKSLDSENYFKVHSVNHLVGNQKDFHELQIIPENVHKNVLTLNNEEAIVMK